MFEGEYKSLEIGDVVYWNGGLYRVDNINGRWGVYGENGWVEINPKESDGFVYVGRVFVPENLNGHCWHYSGTCLSSRSSLMAIYTPDYTCCHCGIRCVAQRELEPQPEGHGKYYPARNRKYLPGHIFDGNDKPCGRGTPIEVCGRDGYVVIGYASAGDI